MSQEITWEVSGGEKTKKKHAFVQPYPIPNDITEGQKLFAENYNSMQAMLMSSGLMEKK